MKELFLGVLSIFVALCILALGGEAVVRGYNYYRGYYSNQPRLSKIVVDREFGWVPFPNYSYEGDLLDSSGETYAVSIQTDDMGSRMYGNPQEESKKKILFIGDSFTQAMQVSDENTYYGILKERLGVEVFAFGVDGYGTLQQYMMLDKVIEDVNPDIVVIQFCPNDFINNSYDLETRSSSNNNGLRRPYYENGEVVYRTPRSFGVLRDFAANYSHLSYLIIAKADRLNAAPVDTVENHIREEGASHGLFSESVETTSRLINKIRQRTPPSVPIYAFATDHGYPYHDIFKRLSEENGIHYMEGVGEKLAGAKRRGVITTAADKEHWNNAGHKIVARTLARYLNDDD